MRRPLSYAPFIIDQKGTVTTTDNIAVSPVRPPRTKVAA